MRKAVLLLGLLLGLLLAASAAPAETFMLLVEQSLDGEEGPAPQAGLQGLMSAMFEAGQVTFDSGPYRPQADWERLQFGESLEFAREGGAHFLATIRLQARSLPAEAGQPAPFAVRVQFQLWIPRGGSQLGAGELELDNLGREAELPYEALLFRAGELAAGELRNIAARR
jgi:hypothetical protein